MKRILLVILFCFLGPDAAAFTDTKGNPWEYSIDYLQQEFIVQGYSDDTYRPDHTINRAEFIKIIIASAYDPFEWEGIDQDCFSDVAPGTWYAPYICFAKSKGIVKGYEDGTFGVERSINQAEALKIILETYQKDIPAVAGEWYDRYFIKADTLGMGYFHTEQPAPYSLTRGEMAYFVAWNLSDPPINQMPWGEPQDVSSDPPLSDTSGAYIPPAPHVSPLQVLSNAHPGQQITTGYITDYHQWALANYAPSISNHTLDKASVDDLQKKLLQAVNQAREDEGKSALKENAILTKLSQEFATHLVINGFYSHSDKLGQDPFDRAEQAKYTGFVTESMTWQQADPLDSITWWKGSDLHWNNIANPDYTQVGVGIVKEPNGRYIVILMTGE